MKEKIKACKNTMKYEFKTFSAGQEKMKDNLKRDTAAG